MKIGNRRLEIANISTFLEIILFIKRFCITFDILLSIVYTKCEEMALAENSYVIFQSSRLMNVFFSLTGFTLFFNHSA